MGRIVHLDRNTVNLIAAGEVIERPASVVKELVENSIDAGATELAVSVDDGGRKLISVTDNGAGMDADDLAAAFDSHATSKLIGPDDLHKITTMGFRGEALPSIASVAHLRAVSRTRDSDQAHCIEIDCGERTPVGPCSGDFGTTMQVRDLFYKTPARRKFLRTANTEMGHISEQFTRIALPQGHLDMTLIHNGRELHRLAPTESLRERVSQLFPMLTSDSADGLIDTQSDEKGIRIRALLGLPGLSRTSSQFQYTFLNGRFIRDKFITHAIKEAYRGLLEANRHPVVFLFIEMPGGDYDVNVHPTKIEVRFYNSNLVHSQVLGVLREKLLGTDLHINAQLPVAEPSGPQTPGAGREVRRQQIADAMADFFKQHRPTHQPQLDLRVEGRPNRPPSDYRSIADRLHPAPPAETVDTPYLQIHDSYIIEQTGEGFVIIDQHALHERMMFDTLQQRLQRDRLESQRLLLPESLEVTDAQAGAIEAHGDLFAQLGIEITPFGPRSYAVQTFPTLLGKVPPAEFVTDLIDLLVARADAVSKEDLFNDILSMAACKAAIKAGQKLTESEIRHLLADRERFESTTRCPHGRPTTIKFSISELEKQFKRT